MLGSPRKVSLEPQSGSPHHLYAALNIKLNPALPARATLQKPLTVCKFGDMTSQFLLCQQFRPVLIGTNYLQVCPWAPGLLMGQLLQKLPTKGHGGYGARLLASACLPTGQRADSLAPKLGLPDLFENKGVRPTYVPVVSSLGTRSLHQQIGMAGHRGRPPLAHIGSGLRSETLLPSIHRGPSITRGVRPTKVERVAAKSPRLHPALPATFNAWSLRTPDTLVLS